MDALLSLHYLTNGSCVPIAFCVSLCMPSSIGGINLHGSTRSIWPRFWVRHELNSYEYGLSFISNPEFSLVDELSVTHVGVKNKDEKWWHVWWGLVATSARWLPCASVEGLGSRCLGADHWDLWVQPTHIEDFITSSARSEFGPDIDPWITPPLKTSFTGPIKIHQSFEFGHYPTWLGTVSFTEHIGPSRDVKRTGLAPNRLGQSLTRPIIAIIRLRSGYRPGEKYRSVEL